MISGDDDFGEDDFGEDKRQRVSLTKREKTITGTTISSSQCSTIMGKTEKLQRPRNYTMSSTIQPVNMSSLCDFFLNDYEGNG